MRITLRRTMIASASVTALLLTMTTTEPAQASATVPFVDTFESSTVISTPWSFNAEAGTAMIEETDTAVGAKAAVTSKADLTLNVDGEPNNIWCQIYAKPTLYDDSSPVPDPDLDVSAAFYVNTIGEVKAYNGGAWQTVGSVPFDGRWLAFAVHSDYSGGGSWNLYVSDDGLYGTPYRRLNGPPLAFRNGTTAEALTEVTISGIAKIDEVYLAKAARLPIDAGSKLDVKLDYLNAGKTTMGLSAQYYAPGANTMYEALGDDLLLWLNEGDSVGIPDADTLTYLHVGTGWNPLDAADRAVYPSSAVWVQKHTAGNFLRFFDYNVETIHERPLYGTANGGLTFIVWDEPEKILGTPDILEFTGTVDAPLAATKDRLYVFRNGQPYMLYWNDTDKCWMDSGLPASDILTQGSVFWYYRGSDDDNGVWGY